MKISLTDDIKKLYNIFNEKEKHAIRSFLRNSDSLEGFENSGNGALADALIKYDSEKVYEVCMRNGLAEPAHLFFIRTKNDIYADDNFSYRGRTFSVESASDCVHAQSKAQAVLYVKEIENAVQVEDAFID